MASVGGRLRRAAGRCSTRSNASAPRDYERCRAHEQLGRARGPRHRAERDPRARVRCRRRVVGRGVAQARPEDLRTGARPARRRGDDVRVPRRSRHQPQACARDGHDDDQGDRPRRRARRARTGARISDPGVAEGGVVLAPMRTMLQCRDLDETINFYTRMLELHARRDVGARTRRPADVVLARLRAGRDHVHPRCAGRRRWARADGLVVLLSGERRPAVRSTRRTRCVRPPRADGPRVRHARLRDRGSRTATCCSSASRSTRSRSIRRRMQIIWVRHAEPERVESGTGVPANPPLTAGRYRTSRAPRRLARARTRRRDRLEPAAARTRNGRADRGRARTRRRDRRWARRVRRAGRSLHPDGGAARDQGRALDRDGRRSLG